MKVSCCSSICLILKCSQERNKITKLFYNVFGRTKLFENIIIFCNNRYWSGEAKILPVAVTGSSFNWLIHLCRLATLYSADPLLKCVRFAVLLFYSLHPDMADKLYSTSFMNVCSE